MVIKAGRDAVFRRTHHPWIYSQAVQEVRGEPGGDALRPVLCADGSLLGWGFHSPQSLIAVRLVAFGPGRPPEDWLEQRIRRAHSLRASLPIDSDAFRLINAEGDAVPGLVIDVYGTTAVVSIHIRGIEAGIERISSCLGELLPGAKVYVKKEEHYARIERLELASGYVTGDGDGTSVIREGGTQLMVDFARGQKTGFYLDQRENRRLAAVHARARSVLNLFSYTGAFAFAAANGGASRLVSVESSRHALEVAEATLGLNPNLEAGRFEWRQEDVFSFLAGCGTFDLIIADPPPFARRRTEVEGAVRGYLNLNQQALRLLNPGGLLFTFSCSGAVDRETYRKVLAEAALRSGRGVRFLRELHADSDHPVAAEHPEGEYLKGWVMHAD